ncbi:sodium/hydrogen exchanger 10-like isoform X2 [Physella acuta]|uniref:sodium/hydrogen exchanger 10-like isoform X2 n=1 Tax=Physella acuta TaxID=109671 RepID=UPI0027DB7C6E|nr:sodium/hydrogen exchanger 10-like isoform X2 [Physella acuta]
MDNLQSNNTTMNLQPLFMSMFTNNAEDPFHSIEMIETQRDFLYLCSIFLIGAVVRHATDVLHIPLPYTVVVFFVGVIAGYLPLGHVVEIGPHTIIKVFMPILIFEGSFAIDIYIFKQIFIQVLILAVPALVVMTFLLAGTSMYLFKYKDWTWLVALLFGSILSATDPVAVVAIMKDLGTHKRLALLIEGESMLNDGTAMVCYELFLQMIEHPSKPGGPLFGYLMAQVAIFWLQWTFNDSLTEIAITLSMAYLVFYIADAYLKVSAVLGVVALGATLSEHRTSISPEVEVFLHSFWETLSFMANTLIFAICGFIITKKVIVNAQLQDCIYLIILYFAVQLIRGLTIMMFSPILKRLGYGLTWQDGLVCTWSGLRGAIGLALALIIFKSEKEPLCNHNVGGKILFHVSLIVVATLLINATTVSHLLTFLGLTDVTPARRNAMKKAIGILDECRRKTMNVWKIDRFLADADWDTVNNITLIEDPFMSTETTEEKELRERLGGVCPRCNMAVPYVPTSSEVHKWLAEATRKYLKLLKQNFWLQFERGLLAGFSVRKLNELAEEAADKDCEMIKVKEIKKMWRTPACVSTTKKLLRGQRLHHKQSFMYEIMHSRSFTVALLYELSHSQALMAGVFGMDCIVIIVTEVLVYVDWTYEGMRNAENGVQNANLVMITLLTAYFLFRLIMFVKTYIKTMWFYVNLSCLVLAYLDLFTHWYAFQKMELDLHFDESDTFQFISKIMITLRTVRTVQIFEVTVSILLYFVKQSVKVRLTTGCDMGRGFVRANELAIRLIDHISDDINVQNMIRASAEKAKMSVLRELGLLQGLHPDVALGVKTCQAIRSVLNVMREGMHHLMEEGGIDEPEGQLFIKVIESKMKRLMAAPPALEIPSTKKILAAIPWIDGDLTLVDYIHNLSHEIIYNYGDIVLRCGEPPDGIYFIISGLVKVEAPLFSENQQTAAMQTLDFLSTGNVIGEISVLTQKHRTATLTCETTVKLLFLSTNDLKQACERFKDLSPPLLARLWKVCAIRISINILANVASYHGMRKETLLARLENAELEHISDKYNQFEITPYMIDVILIMGEAYDFRTREKFIGPCYIPKAVSKLVFTPNQSPRPLMFFALKPSSGRGVQHSLSRSLSRDQRTSSKSQTEIKVTNNTTTRTSAMENLEF